LTSAAGQSRAYALLHGLPLPTIGTFESRLLSEVIYRERSEKYAFAKLLVRLLAPATGLSEEAQYLTLMEYAEELFQLRYNSKYVPVLQRRVREVRNMRLEEERLLSKVEKMTVEGPLTGNKNG
jgi:hypothetical protein